MSIAQKEIKKIENRISKLLVWIPLNVAAIEANAASLNLTRDEYMDKVEAKEANVIEELEALEAMKAALSKLI